MTKLRPVSTQENFLWTDNFSLSCELKWTTNQGIFLSEENFLEWNGPLGRFALRKIFLGQAIFLSLVTFLVQ